jgi:ribosomal protein S18 acetylase RimI-like enzyme
VRVRGASSSPEAGDARVVAELNVVVQALHAEARPDWFLPPDADAYTPVVDAWLQQENVKVFIAEDGDVAVGYIAAVVHERPARVLTRSTVFVELDQIAVRPEWRGRGVGRRLADEVFALAAEVGAESVQLSVWNFNEVAQRFFGSLGFEPMWQRMSAPLGGNVSAETS